MNKVFLDGERVRNYERLKQYRLVLEGNDNILDLHSFDGNGVIYIYISGVNNSFIFGKDNIVNNDMAVNFWRTADKEPNGSQIIIGDKNFFNGSGNSIIAPLDTKIEIGNGNLFAGNIKIWGRNDHIIYDCKSRERLNNDKDIRLGSDNWICEAVTILPGGEIQTNSVVGLGSILNKKISESNVLVAGVPAKIKKNNICWSRASNTDSIDYNNNLNIINKEENGLQKSN